MTLQITSRTDPRLLVCMAEHYSKPKGFVGRNICYAVLHAGLYYGHIVGGSSTRFLPGRNETLGIDIELLNSVINNVFFHIFPVEDRYPIRNFSQKVLQMWRHQIAMDWEKKYGDLVIGWESLVQLPRTGEVYKRDGWTMTGITKGYQCKRIAGVGTDSWTGKRIWDTKNLKPKLVFVKPV